MEITKEQIEATEKVKRFLNAGIKKNALYNKLGIHFLTFDERLNSSNWKKLEIEVINNMKIE